jgi:5-methylcytosine-specific restriction endonuclease McrA
VEAAVLARPVLILNKAWQPIQVGTVQEAIGLVAKGSALIIEPETFERHDLRSWNDVSKMQEKLEGAVIRSCHLALVPPEVILLTTYDGIGEKSVVFSRRNLFKRDRYTCLYCGKQPTDHSELTIDHIAPKSKGGKSTWENCALACVECNKRKADLTLEKSGLKLRKVPKKPSWKSLAHLPPKMRRASWSHFLSEAYWNVELEA